MPTAKGSTKKTVRKAEKKAALDNSRKIAGGTGKARGEFEKARLETMKTLEEAGQACREIKKTLKEIRKLQKETRKAAKESRRDISGPDNEPVSLIERIMAFDLLQKFKPFGFAFSRITTVKWASGEDNIYMEIDGLLENGSRAMAVEIKTPLLREDVDNHLERMERLRKYADEHGDFREFLGAVATAITCGETRDYALSKGFFVIELSGKDVTVTEPAVEPKVW